MHWTNVGLIIVAGMNLGMALIIWIRNPKHEINITLASAIGLVAIWSFAISMFRESAILSDAILWGQVLNLAGILLVIPFFIFAIIFPYSNHFVNLKIWIPLVVSTAIVIIILFIPNLYFSREVFISPPNNSYAMNYGYIVFLAYFYTFMSLAYLNLIKKFLNIGGFIRIQLRYIIVGTGVASLFGSFFGAVSPLFFAGKYFWIGPYFTLPMVVILLYFTFYYSKPR